MTEQRLMKDGLGAEAVARMAGSLEKILPDFPTRAFTKDALAGIQPLELKDRVRHLIGVLHNCLPSDFEQTAEILMAIKSVWDRGDPDDNLAGFAAWPIIDYIGEYGLDYPEKSLEALKELTSMFSAEFAIRPFIINHYNLTIQSLQTWTADPDEHVRRLASEGSRPRLPWGQQLPEFIKNPSPLFQLLENLKDDPSEYVRRSVANNLNDISKDHPERVISCCKHWKKGADKNRQWIIRHATRSLVKAGHPQIFGLLGYTEKPKLSLQSLEITPSAIQIGGAVEFSFALQSTNNKSQSFVIDYIIHHVKANGKTAPKVFKFQTRELAPRETIRLAKKHSIIPITTRKYYSGVHTIEILINGKTFGRADFTLHVT